MNIKDNYSNSKFFFVIDNAKVHYTEEHTFLFKEREFMHPIYISI
jgi:hypothetical protein